MRCPHCQSTATAERPDRTEMGDHRFRCHACQRGLNERTGAPLHRLQYPTDVVCLVVLWRFRYTLSLRDLAEVFLQRGLIFTHEVVRDWEATLAPRLSEGLRKRRHSQAGNSWYVDETDVRVQSQGQYLSRATDRDGHPVDVRLSATRDLMAAEAFVRSAWTMTGVVPDRITTDSHDVHPRTVRNVFGERVLHRTNHDVNNHLEQDHRGIKQRYRPMGGFKAFPTAARFCRLFDEIRAWFRPQSRRNQCLSLRPARCLHRDRFAQVMSLMTAA